jgi:hypothetical protein
MLTASFEQGTRKGALQSFEMKADHTGHVTLSTCRLQPQLAGVDVLTQALGGAE